MTVVLDPVTAHNTAEYAALCVAQNQSHLIAPNGSWLQQAAEEHGAFTYGLRAQGAAAGLASYIDPAAIPEDGDHDGYQPACGFLWRLMVDHRFQRRGIARAALDLLQEQMKQRGLTGMSTCTMDAEPGNALPLYRAAGFVPTGQRLHGEIELVKHFEGPCHA